MFQFFSKNRLPSLKMTSVGIPFGVTDCVSYFFKQSPFCCFVVGVLTPITCWELCFCEQK